jgi:hypothetical protein
MRDAQQQQKTSANEFEARRRLLKLGVYAPPAILGMMIMGQKSAWAANPHCAPYRRPSCKPAACKPCTIKHGKKHGSYGYNKNDFECRKHQSRYRDRRDRHGRD